MTGQPHVAIHPGHRFTTVTIDGATVAAQWKASPGGPWYVTDGTGPASQHATRGEADAQVAEHVAHALESVPALTSQEASRE
ncbi:MAG TPA: hypothetical protein VFX60_19200 [Micromonospora sp.]|nr:hypothetical protein [Micromonospora sp.]